MRAFTLETERFDLRPLTARRLDRLKRIVADPEVVKLLLSDVSTAEGVEAEARKWINDADHWARQGFGCWGIFDRRGTCGRAGALLGVAAAAQALPEIGEGPEVFYFLDRACWGRGVAREAVSAMCHYLFAVRQVPALEASIFAELNPGSVRLAEGLGMRAVGRVPLRQHGLDDARLRELVVFDLWRVRVAPSAALGETLAEAAFRIGQVLAEGFGSLAKSRAKLLSVLAAREADNPIDRATAAALIERRLAEGRQAKGLVLYRVYRADFAAA